MAATMANGGVNPFTGVRIFEESTVNAALSLMKSCGMYDYSGQWSYSVGLPAKSGVGGCVFLVVPRVCGIAIFSPRLDERGNSVRGVDFAQKLLKKFAFHIYDSLKGIRTPFDEKKNPCLMASEEKDDFITKLCIAISNEDNNEMNRLLEEVSHCEEFDINEVYDYDLTTPAHTACASNNIEALKHLLELNADFYNIKDRWGNTPYDRARLANNNEIIQILDVKKQASQRSNRSFDLEH